MKLCNDKRFRSGVFFAAAGLYICIFIFGDRIRQGVSDGMGICLNTVVPSLFPQLVMTAFLSRTGIPPRTKKIVFSPFAFLTGLPLSAAEPALLGLTGGYPVCVKTASQAYVTDRLRPESARRAALVFMHPGPAFTVLTVGKGFCGSVRTGAILYFAVLLADMAMGVLFRCVSPLPPTPENNSAEHTDPADALTGAVADGTKNMLSICAWITAFYGVNAPLGALLGTGKAGLFTEVTYGARMCAAADMLSDCAFALGFGGICVFFQLLPDLRTLGIPVWKYLSARLLCGGLSKGVIMLIQRLELFYTPVFSYPAPEIRLGRSNAAASASLLALCVVFMCSVFASPKKTTIKKSTCHKEKSMLQ